MARQIEKVGCVVKTMQEAANRVARRGEFCTPLVTMMDGTRGRRAFGRWQGGPGLIGKTCYGVYGYGDHWLHYVYDAEAETWYASQETYSRTTTKHARQLCPTHHTNMMYLPQEELHDIFLTGTARWVAARIRRSIA